MKVSELGEFGLIDLLAKMISGSQNNRSAPGKQLITGIGDDAAAWYVDASTQQATVDSLIQDVHFSLSTTSWRDLGWKALAVNLSDIAAMGGIPKYALIALGLPGDTEIEDVIDLYRGMLELAQQLEVAIVGGDTCQAPTVSITITVIGSAQNEHILSRATARPGDNIAVTSYLGSAAAGFEMLTNKLKLDTEATAYLKDAFLRPIPRIAEGQLLVNNGVKTAIDISDGLLSDLRHVCQASRVSARIDVDCLPVHATVRDNFGGRAQKMALSGGEDYELLFTARAGTINKIKKESSGPVTIIGEITAGKSGEISVLDSNGKPVSMTGTGWEHFKT